MPRHGDEPVPGYRLQNRLGRGSFGEVWKASGPGGTLAALKFIALGDSQALREFRAIQRIKQIRHVHLMPIIGIWLIDQNEEVLDDDFLAHWDTAPRVAVDESVTTFKLQKGEVRRPVELIEAMPLGDQDLFGRLQACRSAGEQGIPPDELLGHLEDAAKAIDFLNSPRHDLGEGPVAIHHGDIKPQNIMLVGGSAQVCDFGLARLLGGSQATSTALAGSPAYMSPESIRDKRPHRATDQYSLAITYAELRTGALPFYSASYLDVLNAHLEGKLNFDGLPPAERAVIDRATSLDPEARFGSSLEMIRALQQAVFGGSAVQSGPVRQSGGAEVVPLVQGSDFQATIRSGALPQGATSHRAQAAASLASRIAETTDSGPLVESAVASTPRSVSVGDTVRTAGTSAPAVSTDSRRSWGSVLFVSAAFAGLLIAGTLLLRDQPEDRATLAQRDAATDAVETPPTAGESPTAAPSADGDAPSVKSRAIDPLATPPAPALGKAPVVIKSPVTEESAEPAAEISNSLGMTLRLIPAGAFLMGSAETTPQLQEAFGIDADDRAQPWTQFQDEGPQHRVKITRPFHLGVHEVTVAQFGKFVAASEYKTDAERDPQGGGGWDEARRELKTGPEYTWRSWGVDQTDQSPIVNVSWRDAQEFCKWLSAREGRTYRLPTEAEWEYACRAGTTTRFSSGDDPEGLAEIGNVPDASAREKIPAMKYTIAASDGTAFTAPVGSYRPNAFGLHDLHGNVWEWCADWYGDRYYAESPKEDPAGPTEGTARVLRGGGWTPYPIFCRSSYRGWNPPEYRENFIGFRVVLDPP